MEGTEFAERLTSIFARLNVLVSYLQEFDVKRRIYVNPLGSLNDKFFRGSILFQCVFDSKRRDVFAAGGRYDRLVQEFSPKVLTSRSQTHAVGFNLSWDRLSSSMLDYLKEPTKASLKHPETETGAGGFWKTRRVSEYFFIYIVLRLVAYFSSVTYLSPLLMQLSCIQWASKWFRTCGQTISVQNCLLTPPRLKNFSANTKTITMAGSSSQSRIAKNEGLRSGAWLLKRSST